MHVDLKWLNLEHIVASTIERRYAQLPHNTDKTNFLTNLQKASSELWKLSRGYNVNYALSQMGDAYALYYHMRNTERIYIALDQIMQKVSLPSQIKVLDVGSGTGSGAMAMAFWMYEKYWNHLKNAKLDVAMAEKALPMRDVAECVLNNFRHYVELSEEEFTWNHKINDMLSASRLPDDRTFDVILFCYTFWYQESIQWEKSKNYVLNIAKHLNPGGIMLFLTPTKKVGFIDYLKTDVLSHMKNVSLDIDRINVAPNSTPLAIVSMRKFFEDTSKTLTLPESFIAGNPPYYGFPTQCDIFLRDYLDETCNTVSYELTKVHA